MQFMSCPGPGERQNVRSTNEFYGRTYEDGLVGREFVVMAGHGGRVPRAHCMPIACLTIYGVRCDVYDVYDVRCEVCRERDASACMRRHQASALAPEV